MLIKQDVTVISAINFYIGLNEYQFGSSNFQVATQRPTPWQILRKWTEYARRRLADTCLFWLPSGAYTRSFWIGIFHIGNFCFWVPFLKQLLLRNCAADFVEICKFYVGKMIIKAAKRIFNSDKICRSYSDLNFGITFLEHSVSCIVILSAVCQMS